MAFQCIEMVWFEAWGVMETCVGGVVEEGCDVLRFVEVFCNILN